MSRDRGAYSEAEAKTDEQRRADDRFEELLEQAYWNFDGMSSEGGQGGNVVERDAFKRAVRRFVAEVKHG